MSGGLFDNGEVELYGYRFRITPEPIQESLASTFPGKIVIGDPRRVDDPVASSYVMQDWTGGGLKRWMDPSVDFDRFYYSTCATWYTRQLTLNGLVRTSDAPDFGDGILRDVRAGCAYGGVQYLGYNEYLCSLDVNEVVQIVDTVGSNTCVITDMQVYRLLTGANAGQTWLVMAYIDSGTGVTAFATYDGSSVTGGSGSCVAMTVWDGKLVRCDDTGALYSTTDLATWFPLQGQNVVPLTEGSVTSMCVFPDGAWGLDEIQIATTVGLFWYDEIGQMIRKSRLNDMPAIPGNGRPLVNHKGNLYIPAPSTQILRYTTETVSPEGLDRDDGLPSDFRGQITWVASTLNFLVAATMSTTLVDVSSNRIHPGDNITYADNMRGTRGYAALWIQPRVGGGWHNIFASQLTGTAILWVGASAADGKYRLFFGDNGRLGIIDLYSDLANPLDNTLQEFQPTGIHVTPWNEQGWSEIEKLAIRQKFGAKGTGIVAGGATCTTDIRPACNIFVEYALDYDETNWFPLDTVTTAQPDPVYFGTNGLGLPTKAMRYRYTLNRCDDVTHSPVLVWSTLSFLKVQDARFAYAFTLDLTTTEQGMTPADQAALLRSMADPQGLGATMGVFRGWVSGRFVERHVKVSELIGMVKGGNKQSGLYKVSLVAL